MFPSLEVYVPFYIAYANPSTGARDVATEVQLTPGPALVEYPPEPTGTRLETAGGGVVVQQLSGDSRTRAWVWQNYPAWLAGYQALWTVIEPLRSRYRKLAGDTTPYVYLRDTETALFRTVAISGHTVTPTYPWIRVRVVEVSRRPRPAGGLLVYDDTRLVFVVEDPAWNDYG